MEKTTLVDELARLRAEVAERALSGGDMKLHMERLFNTVLAFKPSLIVELGIRGGVSSYALERGARLVGAEMICVDVNDCSGVLGYAWFVQRDDVEFADWVDAAFGHFCHDRGIIPSVDILMVDTDHTYEQTKLEVEAWLPWMSDRCLMIFHDTNAQPLYHGVARYLREWLGIPFPENMDFKAQSRGWHVEHHAECYGLTLVRRG